jgi:hypothetical protein
MDTPRLLKEDLESGLEFLQEFEKCYRTSVAFWGFSSERERWVLYVAPIDLKRDSDFDKAGKQIYMTFMKIVLFGDPPWVRPDQVQLLPSDSATALDAARWFDASPRRDFIEAGPQVLGNEFFLNTIILRPTALAREKAAATSI